MGGEESEIIRDEFTTVSDIIIHEVGIISFIIITYLYVSTRYDQLQWMRNVVEMLTIKLVLLIRGLDRECLNAVELLDIPDFQVAIRVQRNQLTSVLHHDHSYQRTRVSDYLIDVFVNIWIPHVKLMVESRAK